MNNPCLLLENKKGVFIGIERKLGLCDLKIFCQKKDVILRFSSWQKKSNLYELGEVDIRKTEEKDQANIYAFYVLHLDFMLLLIPISLFLCQFYVVLG